MLQGCRIYSDDFELLHEGMHRFAVVHRWTVIERPTEADPEAPPDPKLVTLETLGLGRLRPIPEPPEVMACETCIHRANATGDGPCVDCDLTFDGPESNYSAEGDSQAVLDAFAARAVADDGDTWGEDNRSNAEVDAAVTESILNLEASQGAPAFKETVDPDAFLRDDENEGEDEP